MNRLRRLASLAALAALLAVPGSGSAANVADQLKLSDVIQTLKFGGDLRLRNENFARTNARAVYRNRNRFRLRVGMEAGLPHDLTTVMRFASGTGEQVSTNQTYTSMSSQKGIFIDQAFLKWTPKVSDLGSVYLASGKMQNMLWRQASSDLIWDDDFNPEGFAEGAEWLLPGGRVSVFGNAMQMVANEDSRSGRYPWLFTQQLGAETRLPFESRLRLAVAYHKWSDEQRITLGAPAVQPGNRRTGAVLTNRFGTGELTGQLSSWVRELPVAFQWTLARNLRTRSDLACPNLPDGCPAARDGYQFGFVLGRAKAAGSWEIGLFKKYAQADVTVADVADSDFGDGGGTNRVGGIFWAAYNPQEWLQAKAKYFTTKVLDTQFHSPVNTHNDVNRLQLDLSVKF